MADSFTTDKTAALKMGTGENENTWGNRLNNEALSPLASAVTNQLSKNVAGASDVTLTAAECKNASLKLTGAILANLSVIVVNGQGFYHIDNATSGGFNLTVKTSAGTGVIVPQGYRTLVYCDGTNVVDALTALNALTADGNSGVTLRLKGSTTTGVVPSTGDILERELYVNTADAKLFTKNGSTIIDLSAAAVPTGVTSPYAGTTAPTGYLLCDGSAVSRTTYAALFAVISTIYGVGDGSTTFNLPDLRGRVVAGQDDMGGTSANRLTNQTGGVEGDTLGATGGAETHELTEAQIPALTLRTSVQISGTPGSANALMLGVGISTTSDTVVATPNAVGDPLNIVQPTIVLNFIIKT